MWKRLLQVGLGLVVVALAAGWLFFWPLLGAIQDSTLDSAEIVVTHLAGSVHRIDALLGERQVGGAVLASVGEDGALLVDSTGSAVLVEKILAELEGLGANRVDLVVTTHPHPDHVGGNERLAAGGAKIAGHPRAAHWLSSSVRPMWFLRAVPPYPAAARPTRLVEQVETLSFNGETVRLVPLGPGHTDGDLIVHFVDSGVAHVGDLFNGRGRYSTVSWINGGEISGLVDGLAKLLAELPAGTLIVGGHSPVGSSATRADLEAYRDVLVRVRDDVASGLRAGVDDERLVAEAEPLCRDWLAESGSAASMHGSPTGWVENLAESLRRSGGGAGSVDDGR